MQLEYGSSYQLANVPFTPAGATQAVESYDMMDYLGQRPSGYMDDGYGGSWSMPVSPMPILGSRNSRKNGRNRYQFWTEWQLLLQRDGARFIADNDPLAIGVIGQLVNFTVGEEAQVNAAVKKGQPKDDSTTEAVKLVQGRIDAFKERMAAECGYSQTFEEWCREYAWTAIVDGEKIDRIYCTPSGAVTRRIESEQVTQPPGGTDNDGWHMGVHCAPGDVTKRQGYFITHEPGIMEGDYVESRDVCFYTRNTPVTVVRGVSDLMPVTDDLADIGRLIDGIRVGAKVKSKIAYIRSVKGTTQQGLEDFVAKTRDTSPAGPSRTPGSGRDGKTRETLPPGTAVNAGDAVDFKTLPAGATDEYINAANFCIRTVMAMRWQLPEYMVNADASNNNFASIMVAGGPSVRAFKANQSSIGARIKMIVRRVLELDMALGLLPMGILSVVDLVIRFPSPVIADPLADAQVKQIEVQGKARSLRSWQTSIGLDPDEEDQQIMLEQERLGQMAQPLPDVFGNIVNGGKGDGQETDTNSNDPQERSGKVPTSHDDAVDS